MQECDHRYPGETCDGNGEAKNLDNDPEVMIDFEMNDTDDGDEISLGNARIADLELIQDCNRDGNQNNSIHY